MRSIYELLLLLLVLVAVVSGLPQSWDNLDDDYGEFTIFPRRTTPPPRRFPIGQALPATTPPPAGSTVPTTASPRFLACMQACPSTNEYNPICGSDNINYHNNGRLNCAIRCGQNVMALRMGTCAPL